MLQGQCFNTKTTALIDLSLIAFNLAKGKEGLLQALLNLQWCCLMSTIAVEFEDLRRDRAISSSLWLLRKINEFSDEEAPGVSLYAPLQSAFLHQIQKNLTCKLTGGRVGNLAIALYTRFFMEWEGLRSSIVTRKCKARVVAEWQRGSKNVELLENALQARLFCLSTMLSLCVDFDASVISRFF